MGAKPLAPGHPSWETATTLTDRVDGGEILAVVAREMDVPRETARNWCRKIHAHRQSDAVVKDGAVLTGIAPENILGGWRVVPDGNGGRFSFRFKNPHSNDDISLSDMVNAAISEALGDRVRTFAPRPNTTGDNLLVIDLADVHFLKLCRATETGFEYNSDVARHRYVEGAKALLRSAKPFGIQRILFVLGNDILHVDNTRNTTTSGTPQDTSGTLFDGFRDAAAAIVEAIDECAKVADVDLVHAMSNHDWVTGWALSQSIAALYADHPNVNATAYNLSESHRKYYRFAGNLIGITHGDGAKEEKLYGLMVKEARQHISECKNLYWLLHHVHHKIRKRRGVDVFQSEKDHNGMSAHIVGAPAVEGAHIDIEYVRSPSAPDGWHDRNGYVNRQGVECFIYHPHDGQKVRFTEWF